MSSIPEGYRVDLMPLTFGRARIIITDGCLISNG